MIWSAPVGVNDLYNNHKCASATSNNCWYASTNEALDFYNSVTQTPATLPNLTYIVPCPGWSDHPIVTRASAPDGPNWVGFIVRTIAANSDIWSHAVIIITWDDWGGWYDPVPPPFGPLPSNSQVVAGTTILNPDPYNSSNLDPYEFGYRVPMLIISPYLGKTPGVVDHTARSTAAILNFIENTFSVPKGALKTLDNVSGKTKLCPDLCVTFLGQLS